MMMRLMSLTGPSLKRRITRDTRMSLRVKSITRQLRASHPSQERRTSVESIRSQDRQLVRPTTTRQCEHQTVRSISSQEHHTAVKSITRDTRTSLSVHGINSQEHHTAVKSITRDTRTSLRLDDVQDEAENNEKRHRVLEGVRVVQDAALCMCRCMCMCTYTHTLT